MVQFLFKGKNYVGPVKEVMQIAKPCRVLDLGTGSGSWAIDIADEFPRAEVIGIDLAPIQPREVPPNCTFELYDLDSEASIPYPDGHFDLIHARSMHTGIRSYPHLLREISRLLVPGGLVILIEPDLRPLADGKLPSHFPEGIGAPGWFALWETYRACLMRQGIDVNVPQRLTQMVLATREFEKVIELDGNIPVGFWPTDQVQLTVGQLQWLDYDLFLPALRPLFLSSGLSEGIVTGLIADAQRDLYHPDVKLSVRLHIVHASKASQ
ncbi:S-adenosyl-L-methionine-dependent methyltransferase [Mycena floridula]|nr:S-adenosyl-L-methionine-dependent methyltransferase [Mycena floridula]